MIYWHRCLARLDFLHKHPGNRRWGFLFMGIPNAICATSQSTDRTNDTLRIVYRTIVYLRKTVCYHQIAQRCEYQDEYRPENRDSIHTLAQHSVSIGWQFWKLEFQHWTNVTPAFKMQLVVMNSCFNVDPTTPMLVWSLHLQIPECNFTEFTQKSSQMGHGYRVLCLKSFPVSVFVTIFSNHSNIHRLHLILCIKHMTNTYHLASLVI